MVIVADGPELNDDISWERWSPLKKDETFFACLSRDMPAIKSWKNKKLGPVQFRLQIMHKMYSQNKLCLWQTAFASKVNEKSFCLFISH